MPFIQANIKKKLKKKERMTVNLEKHGMNLVRSMN